MNQNDTYTQAAQKLLDLGYRVTICKDLEGEIFGLEVDCSPILRLEEKRKLTELLGEDYLLHWMGNQSRYDITYQG